MNLVAWHDRDAGNHTDQFVKHSVQGFRIISLSVYGDSTSPLYASVMILKSGTPQQVNLIGLTAKDMFLQAIPDLSKKGYHPVLISATGPANMASFAGVFEKQDQVTAVRADMTVDHWSEWTEDALMKRNILRSVDVYGTPDDPRIVAVWSSNSTHDAWACDAIDEAAAPLQQRFDAMSATWARPVRLAVTPAGRMMEMFTDSQIGAWASQTGMTSQQYQAKVNAFSAQGLWPVCVDACTTPAGNQFAAIFAKKLDTDTRTFRPNGPTSVDAIDSAMEVFMQAHGIRGSALAIVEGARLVYARGYTWAEPSYPDVEPTTLFRQASCSKILAAMGIYAIYQYSIGPTQSIADAFNHTMQSILQLRQPDGSLPLGQFSDITIRHLLESTSGLDNNILWESFLASQAMHPGGTAVLPATREQLAIFAATQPLAPAPGDPNHPATPGDPNNAAYGNTGYFMLSEIIRTLKGVASFEEALGPLIFQPLELTRIRRSVSLIGAQQPHEARYHLAQYQSGADSNPPALWPLQCLPSLRTSDQPLVAAQYGGWDMEAFAGSGGLSAAVVDMARIVASFSLRNNHPIFPAKTLDAWFNMAAEATIQLKGPDAHGYHGWDWAAVADPENHVYQAMKGGYLPGNQSWVQFTTGGLGVVMAMNGNQRQWENTDWFQPVINAAVAHDWGASDLFTKFFKTALAPTLFNYPKVATKPWPQSATATMDLTRRSIQPRLSRMVQGVPRRS